MMTARTMSPRLVNTAPHGTGPGSAGGGGEFARMAASSAAFTPECSAGSFRNQNQNPAAQAAPTIAYTRNTVRHPETSIRYAVAAGATTAPTWANASITPCTRPRSPTGYQREMARAAFGNAPASAAPNRNRTSTSESSPVAAPVSAVNADHASTMTDSTDRGPSRSPYRPTGTAKRP